MSWDFSYFGRKKTKKEIKRETIVQNRRKGKAGENLCVMNHALRGEEVERTGRGHDFRVRRRDIFGRVVETKVVEVKTGNAKLSKLQKKTKNKKSNYSVEHYDPIIY